MAKVLLIGTPNTGKSLLFNRLTGLRQKVANFPGVTVETCSGPLADDPGTELIDYPGTYSLAGTSGEEGIANGHFKEALSEQDVVGVICVVDSTRLGKSLVLAQEVVAECAAHAKPVVIAANMGDVLTKYDASLDHSTLSRKLGAEVVMLSAKTGSGTQNLIKNLRNQPAPEVPEPAGGDALGRNALSWARLVAPDLSRSARVQARLDKFFLGSLTGALAFGVVMYLLFQSIFTWAAPLMDATEAGVGAVAEWVVPWLPGEGLQAFVSDALFGGFGAFLVFVPQIFVLSFVIGLLEDSGYLARAAVLCHRPLSAIGLTGKSFAPMLSGVACAVPAIYAARSVESPRKRWLTYLAIPLMPCSARLPVYALLVAAFVPRTKLAGGLIGLQGLAFFALYLFGIAAALIVTGLVSRSRRLPSADMPFILELPAYRLPNLVPILRQAAHRARQFVVGAGPIIFVATAVIWFLGYFPHQGGPLESSWLGQFGKLIEPVFAPLGIDWRFGLGILTSFLAREVFVGTLGTLFGLDNAVDDVAPLIEQIQEAGLTLPSAGAILVFFAIALMCVSTVATLRKESGSARLAWGLFVAYSAGGYLLAVLCYHLLNAFT